MTPVLFCMLPFLDYYDGTERPDLPEGMNFLPITMTGEDGSAAELLFGALHGKSRIPTESISSDTDSYISGVTVVFCAKAENGALVTVGWYENANVTQTPEILPCENEDGSAYDHPFFFCARREQAVLLPTEERFAAKWVIPRNRSGAKNKYGFGQDSLWFAEEPTAQLWKKNFLLQLQQYNGENWLFPAEDENDDAL